MSLAGSLLWAALAAVASPPSVDITLGHEPGAAPTPFGTLHQAGRVDAGGAAGQFSLDASLGGGPSQLTTRSGPMIEANGWDTSAWSSRDGAVLSIGLPSAIEDAAAERFLRRYGWRDRSARKYMRPLPTRWVGDQSQWGIEVALPGASRINLWFDENSGRLAEAVTRADMGPLTTTFSDWRRVGMADYAYRRQQQDAAGQRTILAVETSSITRSSVPARPKSVKHGILSAPVTQSFLLDKGNRGHIVVNAEISGQPAKLVFDTGAANYLTPREARHFGLTVEGGLNIGGVGETSITGGYARIPTLDIGGAHLINTVAIIAPLPNAAIHPSQGLMLQGLTGAELLDAFTITIDYASRSLTFAPPGAAIFRTGTVLPLVSDGQGLFIQASVEGWAGWFRLDTGDPGTVTLFPGFARQHRLSNGAVRTDSSEVGGALSTLTKHFSRVALASHSFADVTGEVSVQQAGSFSSRTIGGNLGVGLLSCFVITLDVHQGRAMFKPLPARRTPAACVARSPRLQERMRPEI